jgi:hypothetical protein
VNSIEPLYRSYQAQSYSQDCHAAKGKLQRGELGATLPKKSTVGPVPQSPLPGR